MPVLIPSTAGDDAAPPGTEGLAARVAAGPGLWENEDWLADLRRESLLESLLAGRALAAAAGAGHGHLLDRALNAEVTALCLVAGALFPALGYDGVLALVFSLPGVPARPGVPVPSGPACSKARPRHGEDPARAMSGADAAGAGVPPLGTGPRSACRSPRSTAPPWKWPPIPRSRTRSGSPRPAPGRCCG